MIVLIERSRVSPNIRGSPLNYSPATESVINRIKTCQ